VSSCGQVWSLVCAAKHFHDKPPSSSEIDQELTATTSGILQGSATTIDLPRRSSFVVLVLAVVALAQRQSFDVGIEEVARTPETCPLHM